MSKMVRLDEETYSLLEELKFILRKRSLDATLKEILDNVMEEDPEDSGFYQADFEDFDE